MNMKKIILALAAAALATSALAQEVINFRSLTRMCR